MQSKTRTLIGCTVAATTVGLALGIGAPTLATTPASRASAKIGTVYQGKIVNQDIVLGPQANPTLLTQTPTMPAGNYLVTAIVGAVISAHDQIVCAADPSGSGSDGVFGTAGNAGTGNIYGTATITDTLHITAGQQIQLSCNSFNYGQGTYAGDAVINAVPVHQVN